MKRHCPTCRHPYRCWPLGVESCGCIPPDCPQPRLAIVEPPCVADALATDAREIAVRFAKSDGMEHAPCECGRSLSRTESKADKIQVCELCGQTLTGLVFIKEPMAHTAKTPDKRMPHPGHQAARPAKRAESERGRQRRGGVNLAGD